MRNVLLLLPLPQLLLLLPLLRCCSAVAAALTVPHGVGQPEIYSAFPPRAPPGSPAPTVEPAAASGVHDVLLLLRLLFPLLL